MISGKPAAEPGSARLGGVESCPDSTSPVAPPTVGGPSLVEAQVVL